MRWLDRWFGDNNCNRFYVRGKLLPMNELPTWYVQFLASSPPEKDTEFLAKTELERRIDG